VKSERLADWTASDWLVALADAPQDADLRARFADWLEADPENLRDWQAIARTYRSLGAVRPAGAPRRAANDRRLRARAVAALAGAAVAACLLLLVLPGLLRELRSDYATGTAEIRSVELADGSVVRLAPESAIDVDYGPAGRRVRLREGIALFEVSPDPARPFTVLAAETRTTAVGTVFEVRRGARGDSVAVREGVVEVERSAPGEQPLRVAAGERASFASDGTWRRTRLPAGQVGLWVDGLLVARERPVADLVDELRRYHTGLILLDGDALARQPATGVYDARDPAAALDLLASSQTAQLYEISPWILVLRGP
jgi:transmembrane sensor